MGRETQTRNSADVPFLRTFLVTVAFCLGALTLFGALWLVVLWLTGGPLSEPGCGFSCGAGSSVSPAPSS